MPKPHLMLIIVGISACSGDKDALDSAPAGWPEGLEPVRACEVPPIGDASAPVEEFNYEFEEGEPGWVCGSGWIQAPIADVIAAMAEPDAVVNRRAASDWEVTWDEPPRYDVGYMLHVTVPDILTVEFDLQVMQGLVSGTHEAPEHVSETWEKVDGFQFIYLLEGSAQAYAEGEDLTLVVLAENLHGASGGIEPSVSSLRDFYADILALSHGEPLPEYD